MPAMSLFTISTYLQYFYGKLQSTSPPKNIYIYKEYFRAKDGAEKSQLLFKERIKDLLYFSTIVLHPCIPLEVR